MKKKFCAFLCTLLPFIAGAWNSVGHSTGGAIAYYYLKANSPQTINKVVAILQRHPWYNRQDTLGWAPKLAGLTAEQKKLTLFMLASTFPDDARPTPLGNGIKTQWHYVDYPFVPAGQTVTPQNPKSPNAEEKINELVASVNKETDPAQKAIDICWIFHLIEDVHQPLHASSMFDKNRPNGDEGGNLVFIQFSGASPFKLHSYWDGLIKGSVKNAPATAQALLAKPQYKESSLTELKTHPKVHDWIVSESFALAKSTAYKNGAVNGTETNPTPVDNSYAAAASQVAERRIVLAGIRLAKTLIGLNS